jgi:uncharacterized membrane protein
MLMSGSSVYFKSLVTILGCAALFALMAIPLILRKMPRNAAYGFRTPKTLSSDEIWYDANAYFGRAFLIANVATTIAMLILYNHQQQFPPVQFIKLSLAILITPSIIAVLLTFRHIHSLSNKT